MITFVSSKEKVATIKKIELIVTNIDTGLNNKHGYNFDEVFSDGKTGQKFIQTQNEIEIKINENEKVKDVLLSEDYLYLSFQQWLILNDGKLKFY